MIIIQQPNGTYKAYFHGLFATGYKPWQAIMNAIALSGITE